MGTDGGTDSTIERLHHLVLDLDVEALDGELDRVIEGLRLGDLAFVVAAAVRLGPAVAACLAAAGSPTSTEQVADVAFALADLTADPATVTWSAGELLAVAVERVAGTRVDGSARSGSPAR